MADKIQTERLLMRRARADDLEPLHHIMRDAEAMRYWSTPPHSDLAETERWLGSMMNADPVQSDDFIVTVDGRLIGKLGAWKLPEIGFFVDRNAWGKGYASEALAAFIIRRRDLGSEALTADVDPRNMASIRLLERHGFIETGRAARTWQVGDEWCDSVYFELAL